MRLRISVVQVTDVQRTALQLLELLLQLLPAAAAGRQRCLLLLAPACLSQSSQALPQRAGNGQLGGVITLALALRPSVSCSSPTLRAWHMNSSSHSTQFSNAVYCSSKAVGSAGAMLPQSRPIAAQHWSTQGPFCLLRKMACGDRAASDTCRSSRGGCMLLAAATPGV